MKGFLVGDVIHHHDAQCPTVVSCCDGMESRGWKVEINFRENELLFISKIEIKQKLVWYQIYLHRWCVSARILITKLSEQKNLDPCSYFIPPNSQRDTWDVGRPADVASYFGKHWKS